MADAPIRWTIRPFLARHNISAYRLVKATGLSQGTVYRLVNGRARSLNAETVGRVLVALRNITGESVLVGDVVAFEDSR